MDRMNLFDFYREVVDIYQCEHLGIGRIDSSRARHLESLFRQMQSEYFNSSKMSYSDCDRKLAYCLSFAPRHATIWHEWAKCFVTNEPDEDWKINSIGTGPGAELFGILLGCPDISDVNVEIKAFEQEESWRDLLEIARDLFQYKTGRNFKMTFTTDPDDILTEGQVFGSFVLTDAIRGQSLPELLGILKCKTKETKAYFLDFPVYTCKEGTSKFVNSEIRSLGFKCSDKYLRDLNIDLAEPIQQEVNAAHLVFDIKAENPTVCWFEVDIK